MSVEDCSICLTAFEANDKIVQCNNKHEVIGKPNVGCNKYFHVDCIIKWYNRCGSQKNCPTCRRTKTFVFHHDDNVLRCGVLFYEDLAMHLINSPLQVFKDFCEKHEIELNFPNLFHKAIESKNTEVINYMIDNGANVHALSHPEKNSTLITAVEAENYETFKMLLYAGVDIRRTNASKECVIHYLLEKKQIGFVKMLCEEHNALSTSLCYKCPSCSHTAKIFSDLVLICARQGNSEMFFYLVGIYFDKNMDNINTQLKLIDTFPENRKGNMRKLDLLKKKKTLQIDLGKALSNSIHPGAGNFDMKVLQYYFEHDPYFFDSDVLELAIWRQRVDVLFFLLKKGIRVGNIEEVRIRNLIPEDYTHCVSPYFTEKFKLDFKMDKNITYDIISGGFEYDDRTKMVCSKKVSLSAFELFLEFYEGKTDIVFKQIYNLYDMFQNFGKENKKKHQQHILDHYIKPIIRFAERRKSSFFGSIRWNVIIKFFVDNFDVTFVYGNDTAIHGYVRQRRFDNLELLLNYRKHAEMCMNFKDFNGKTPMMIAVSGKRLPAVRLIMGYAKELKVKLDVVDNEGNTALQIAIQECQLVATRMLRNRYTDNDLGVANKNNTKRTAEDMVQGTGTLEKYYKRARQS
jgi:ankyrin repeat protein